MTRAPDPSPVALVTGGSRGLGLALVGLLTARGWRVVTDARDGAALRAAVAPLPRPDLVTAVPGDVCDLRHREALLVAADRLGGLDALVNNAGVLGPSPRPALAAFPAAALARVLEVNAVAPAALAREALPLLIPRRGRVIAVTSDAAVEAYAGWGAYGASKAALEQLTAVLGVENPGLRVYSFDPGDMATRMQEEAFPGADLTGLPGPEPAAAALAGLLEGDLPSGRYRAADLAAVAR